MFKHLFVRITLLTLLAAGMFIPPAARAASAEKNRASEDSAKIVGGNASPTRLMNADGTLIMDGSFSGALDLSGWNVQINSERGPVFSLPESKPLSPLSTASLGEWADLGGGNGALNSEVYAVAVMGSDVYVAGNFSNADGDPNSDNVARWDGASWHSVGSGNPGAGGGAISSAVLALAVDGTDLYVGGWFCGIYNGLDYIPEACRIAKWDGSDWTNVGSNGGGQGAISGGGGGPVYALAADGAGNLYAGGSFTNVFDGSGNPMPAADYLVKWNGGAWSALGSGSGGNGSLNNAVYALDISGTDVYAGGGFVDVSNGGSTLTAADYIAKWNGSTWSALGSDGGGTPDGSLNSVVYSIAIDGANIYVGGQFYDLNNSGTIVDAADYIAKWNGSAWSAVGSGSGGNGSLSNSVQSIAVSGTNVYVSGYFTDANNGGSAVPEADYIAVFSTVSGGWSALGSDGAGNGSLTYYAKSIAIGGSHLYVGGSFTSVRVPGDVLDEADYIADWNGSNWSGMGSVQGALNHSVTAVTVSGTDVYVGGSFTNLSNHGTPMPEADYIARWDGSNWHALGTDGSGNGVLPADVTSIAVSGPNVYAGGYWGAIWNSSVYIPEAAHVARFDGTNWSALGSNGLGGGSINGNVYAVAVSGSNVYVGGSFENVVDIDETPLPAADYIARWDGSNWHALGSGSGGNGSLNSSVAAIAVSGSNVYAGGLFDNVKNGGTTLNAADYIAKWDGSNWSALGSGLAGDGSLNSQVTALAVSGSTVYAVGYFADVKNSGTTLFEADYIAKWDGSNWSALGNDGSSNGSLSGPVTSIAVRGSTLYAGGYFTNVTNSDGVPLTAADYVARWNGTTWSALGSDGGGTPNGSLGTVVYALGVTGTELYAGGEFLNANNNGTPLPYGDYIAAYGVPSINADTAGVFRPSSGALFMKNSNSSGFADLYLTYGIPGDYPVVGDWDNNGTTTLGVFRGGTFYLRNSNTNGFADNAFGFGVGSHQPIAGDWNNDGVDTIGVYDSATGTFFLRNTSSTGAADMTFTLGIPGDVGIAGDWNGDGVDTVGVFRPSNGALYLKNTNATGFADIVATYGIPGDKPVTGDWDGNGTDTIGVYRGGTFYLRNSNDVGFADLAFALGIPGDMPIAGDWDGLP